MRDNLSQWAQAVFQSNPDVRRFHVVCDREPGTARGVVYVYADQQKEPVASNLRPYPVCNEVQENRLQRETAATQQTFSSMRIELVTQTMAQIRSEIASAEIRSAAMTAENTAHTLRNIDPPYQSGAFFALANELETSLMRLRARIT